MQLLHLVIILGIYLLGSLSSQDPAQPFRIKADLYDQSQPQTLGLSRPTGLTTITICKAGDISDKYVNGVVLFPFKGCLYAQWQSSAVDEDASDTWVAYSRSRDGINWTSPDTLAKRWSDGIKTSGGWWSDGETLVAYINVWPANLKSRGGYSEYILSRDGLKWSDPQPLRDSKNQAVAGIFEQDPHALPDGRIINAIHLQPGLTVTPFYTDDPLGIEGWTRGIMPNITLSGHTSRAIEPSSFFRADGSIVMIFRDQNSSFKKLASVSTDRGQNWSLPIVTQMPDSRSKQCAGNFGDGYVYMIHNPVNNKTRIPLVITLSRHGYYFDKAFLLRDGGTDLQHQKYTGKYKRAGYHYPKSIVWKNDLYVSYATNKEDVELTRIPLTSLMY